MATSILFQEEGQIISNGLEELIALAEKLDFTDVQILRRFYLTGKEIPFDCQPYCFPILYMEMKSIHRLQIGVEALRKRVSNLVKMDLLEKVENSNPTNYVPIRDKSEVIRALIAKFFAINGLNKFL